MGSFWRILLVSVFIFYLFSMIIKWIFRRKMRKLQEQMEQLGQNDTQTKKDKDKNPHIDPNIGEYTDFEEIE